MVNESYLQLMTMAGVDIEWRARWISHFRQQLCWVPRHIGTWLGYHPGHIHPRGRLYKVLILEFNQPLKYCILLIVMLTTFCLRIPNLHSLRFIASPWLLHLDFIQNPVSRHLRLCWRRNSFLWATQNVVLPWDVSGKKGRETMFLQKSLQDWKHFKITETITNIVCRPRQSTGGRITENMICAANEEEGSDTCQVGLR